MASQADPNCPTCHGSGTVYYSQGENDYSKDVCDCVDNGQRKRSENFAKGSQDDKKALYLNDDEHCPACGSHEEACDGHESDEVGKYLLEKHALGDHTACHSNAKC